MIYIYISLKSNQKKLTVVENLPIGLDKKNFIKKIKENLNCNVTIIDDKIYLQGDRKINIKNFLIFHNI